MFFYVYNNQKVHMERAFSIIKELHLEYYLNVVLTKNMSNVIPYHNLKHTLTMMTNAYDISTNNRTEIFINEKELRSICIAALFHDFNHSGGTLQSDEDNISLAIDAWRKYSKEEPFWLGFVEGLIKGTQYPYTSNHPTYFVKILRDADMMQWFEDDFIEHTLMGLNKEMLGKSSLSIQMLEGQLKFMENAKWHTPFAKANYDANFKYKVDQIKWLIKILNEN